MKLFLGFLFALTCVNSLSEQETADLNGLAHHLYQVEDKLDHLLYHFNHDVTRHEYTSSPLGNGLASAPKNPNSIHQKLKLIDNLNMQMAKPATRTRDENSAYNINLGGPAMPIAINQNMKTNRKMRQDN